MTTLTSCIIGTITEILHKRKVTVMWLPDLQTERKFTYNTNIRHEDDMGRDLHLKGPEELCREVEHCGSKIMLMLNTITYGRCAGTQVLYYDSY